MCLFVTEAVQAIEDTCFRWQYYDSWGADTLYIASLRV